MKNKLAKFEDFINESRISANTDAEWFIKEVSNTSEFEKYLADEKVYCEKVYLFVDKGDYDKAMKIASHAVGGVISENINSPMQTSNELRNEKKAPEEIIENWVETYLNRNGLPTGKRQYAHDAGESIMTVLKKNGYEIVKKK